MTLPDRIAQARKLLTAFHAAILTRGTDEEVYQHIFAMCRGDGWDAEFAALFAAAPQLVRDLLAEIDRLQPYLQHRPECAVITGKGGGISENVIVLPKCSCEFSSLRDGQPA